MEKYFLCSFEKFLIRIRRPKKSIIIKVSIGIAHPDRLFKGLLVNVSASSIPRCTTDNHLIQLPFIATRRKKNVNPLPLGRQTYSLVIRLPHLVRFCS